MRELKSIQNWFTKRHYEPGTEETYLLYMTTFCGITGKNADQLGSLTLEEALEAQKKIATVMKEELGLSTYSIHQRIHALHTFWVSNGIELTEDLKKYKGLPWLLRESIRRR
jgi:hypothetical protein